MSDGRWQHCVSHRGQEAEAFIREYLGSPDRGGVLFVGGAGFDPRSARILRVLAASNPPRLRGIFLREERPNPDAILTERAVANVAAMEALVPDSRVVAIDVFADDGAVVGGLNAVNAVREAGFDGIGVVVIDFSALSVGVAFPLTRFVYESARDGHVDVEVHVVVMDQPTTDGRIRREAHDTARYVTGFTGTAGLTESRGQAKLWLPQLVEHRQTTLRRIYAMVEPDDVCPILPFPSSNPRRADALLEHYAEDLESAWEVTPHNLVYADEKNPLDLYRAILRIDDFRARVFHELGGAQTVLSPMANKALSIGAFMAAVERDFPVAYVEAEAYRLVQEEEPDGGDPGEIIHVWLH